jgi:hypothetical protein
MSVQVNDDLTPREKLIVTASWTGFNRGGTTLTHQGNGVYVGAAGPVQGSLENTGGQINVTVTVSDGTLSTSVDPATVVVDGCIG